MTQAVPPQVLDPRHPVVCAARTVLLRETDHATAFTDEGEASQSGASHRSEAGDLNNLMILQSPAGHRLGLAS